MATYYFRSTGTIWGATGDWSSTPSPTYTAGAVPLITDDVIFEAASASCTIDTTTRVCKSLTCTSYTGNLNFANSLQVNGNIALGSSSMTVTGSGTLNVNMNGLSALSLSSGGCICAVPISFTRSPGGSVTITMGSSWTQTGNFTVTNSGSTVTFNGNTFVLKSPSIAFNNSISGSTTFLISTNIGDTTDVTSAGTPTISVPLTINAGGTINLNISFIYANNTFTYTAGEVIHTGQLTVSGATYATSGIVFQNGATPATGLPVITLSQDITFSGNFIIPGGVPTVTPAGRKVIVGGNFTNNNSGGTLTWGSSLMLNGSGTISGTSTGNSALTLEINTAGTYTFSGSILWLRTLLFNGGTTIGTGSTMICSSVVNFTVNSTGLNLGTLTTITANFLGTRGFTMETYNNQTAGTITTFKAGNTYRISTSLNLLGTAASNISFRSDTAGVQAIVNLDYGASIDIGHVTATDINSSGGQTIWNYKGTLSNTTNWEQLPTVPKTIGKPWVR